MKRKGAILFLPKTFLLIIFIIFVIVLSGALIVISKFSQSMLFQVSADVVYNDVSAEDLLLALLNYESSSYPGVTFRKALYYAIEENNYTNPYVFNGTSWIKVNLTNFAGKYLNKMCRYKTGLFSSEKGKYVLFITNGTSEIDIVTHGSDFGKKSRRSSVALGERKWLVLYEYNCLSDYAFSNLNK
ncbi:MAG: hypothetical protein J7L43_01130 [Candidatus Aenigmarchaeota archaeon]|nr:hypothetical protein [Candidatus Aenigmarchaeota archaeon]